MPCTLETLDSGLSPAEKQAQWLQHLKVEAGESECREELILSTYRDFEASLGYIRLPKKVKINH